MITNTPQNKNAFQEIIERLFVDVNSLSYGHAGVTVRVHDGRVVEVTHSVTSTAKRQVVVKGGNDALSRNNF